jgi:hypothetical protein
MKTVYSLMSKYKSFYAASKELGVNAKMVKFGRKVR